MSNIVDDESGVRIVYRRGGYETPFGHIVRNRMEGVVCQWLVDRGVAHRHASEMFTVTTGPAGTPDIYVPDIILHDKTRDGKTIIIEPLQSSSPKGPGTKIFAAFRRQMKSKYYVIVIARKNSMKKVLKNAYDVLIDFEKLHLLERRIPIPE